MTPMICDQASRCKYLMIFICLSILIGGCGPSPEEQAGTAAAQTAAAATDTPIPTQTPIPTSTLTPTPTATPTPLPDPDPSTMIDLELLNLPGSFKVHSPDLWGVEPGAIAFGTGNNIFMIHNSFVFAEESRGELVFGYSALLPDAADSRDVDEILADFLVWFEIAYDTPEVTLLDVSEIPGADGIGDRSAGVRVDYLAGPNQIVLEQVTFRIGDILASANVKNFLETTSSVSVIDVAEVYARNINYPVQSCKIANVKALFDDPWPMFNYIADGFYPNEAVMILVDGKVEFGGETYTIANIDGVAEEMAAVRVFTEQLPYTEFELFGFNMVPHKVDNTGMIYDSIMQTVVETESEVVYSDQHQITVYGLYSGCVASAPAVWESPE